MHGVICLAFDVLEDMSKGGAKPPFGGGVAGVGGVGEFGVGGVGGVGGQAQPRAITDTGLDLDGYDEATRLEAEAVLGCPGVPRRPSDPLGEESRRSRVQYYYRT